MISRELWDKYPFLRVCEFYRYLEKVHYNRSISRLYEIYNFIKEVNLTDNEFNKEYMGRLIQSVESSEYVLKLLNIQPFNMVFTGMATIQLEYELSDNSYLELEIYPDYITYLFLPKRFNYKIFKKEKLDIFEGYKLFEILNNFFYNKEKLNI